MTGKMAPPARPLLAPSPTTAPVAPPAGDAAVGRAPRLVLRVVFAGTGFSALTLQVVWQRVISMHGGVDLFSTTTVVAAFLAGLGLGSLLGGFLADRLGPRRSLLAFAASNAGIAAFALVSIWLFYDLYRTIVPSVHGLLPSFAFHVALLVVPTTLMGLSLPLVARGVVGSARDMAPLVGRLYAVNTFGAAAGAAVSGWWLLGTFGFAGTVRVAAALNLAAALLVLSLWRTAARAGRRPDRVVAPAPPGPPQPAAGRGRVWQWFAVYALTGAVALGLEVVFFRLIDSVMRSNSYSFAHVLTLYLLLFSGGAALGSRLVHRTRRPERWFLWLQCAAGAAALTGVLLLVVPLRLPAFLGIRPFLETYFSGDGMASGDYSLAAPGNLRRLLFANLVAPLLVMGGPVLLVGASFPFIQAVVARRVDTLGRRTGALLFSNIAGNVAGTLVVGFVLLDRFGTSTTLRLLAGLLLVPGLAAAGMSRGGRRVALALLATAVIGFQIWIFPSNRVLWGFLHTADLDAGFTLVEERSCADGLVRRGGLDVLTVNGASQNGYPWDEFHVLIGLAPAVLHPAPERALAVGLGMGGTTYGMAQDRRLDRVDTVEICGGQLDVLRSVARRGAPEPAALLADPRVDLQVGDGREYLLRARRDLDIVTVDTLRPQSGYSGNLYSTEFYELVRSRLRDDGLFAQWVPSARALNGVRRVFPHVVVLPVASYGGSQFLIASARPIRFDPIATLGRVRGITASGAFAPPLAGALERFFAELDPVELPPPGPVPDRDVNRDLFPRDEYFLND